MTVEVEPGHRARPPERLAEAARPVVPGRRVDQRAGDDRRHGRQQLLRLAPHRLRQHGAQRARHRCLAGRRQRGVVRPGGRPRRRRSATIAEFVRGLARARSATRSRRSWPKVLRRVGGYNLDIFRSAERAAVHRATAASTWRTCWSAPRARWRSPPPEAASWRRCRAPRCSASSTSRPSTRRWTRRSTSSSWGRRAVELVDRTMIELARANPAFRPTIEAALIGAPGGDPAGRVQRRRPGARCCARLRALVELMGDLGLPGSVVEMPDEAPQKALWEVRKAGLNIMMSLKGDGKPVSFIEDCAVPLEHLAEYTDALTEVFAPPRHARHLVRACLGRHAARAADPRHAPRRRREDARDRRGSRARWCASSRAPTAASTATACAAANGSHGSSARGSTRRSARSSSGSTRSACSIPARSSTRRRWTTRACSASRRATGRSR